MYKCGKLRETNHAVAKTGILVFVSYFSPHRKYILAYNEKQINSYSMYSLVSPCTNAWRKMTLSKCCIIVDNTS